MLCSQEEGAVRLPVTVFRLISIFALLAVLPDASLPISLFLCCCLPLGTQLLLLSIPRALGGGWQQCGTCSPLEVPFGLPSPGSGMASLELWGVLLGYPEHPTEGT